MSGDWRTAEGVWPSRLHCGACGKVLARLMAPASIHLTDDRMRASWNPLEGIAKRPDARPALAQVQVTKRFEDTSHFTFTVACHPKRCGRIYSLRDDRVRTAMVDARGRQTLIVGPGPYATEHGGPDI